MGCQWKGMYSKVKYFRILRGMRKIVLTSIAVNF